MVVSSAEGPVVHTNFEEFGSCRQLHSAILLVTTHVSSQELEKQKKTAAQMVNTHY